jgi:hypothetical protein
MVPEVGTFTVNPLVASDVAKGTPVVAVEALVVNWQLEGVEPSAVANVTATVVDAEIVHAPARIAPRVGQ